MDTLERTRSQDALPPERSLVERAQEVFRHGNEPEPDNPAPEDAPAFPDGYVRLSPRQPYRVPEGYYRSLVLKAVLYGVAAVLLSILIAALMRRGLLRF